MLACEASCLSPNESISGLLRLGDAAASVDCGPWQRFFGRCCPHASLACVTCWFSSISHEPGIDCAAVGGSPDTPE